MGIKGALGRKIGLGPKGPQQPAVTPASTSAPPPGPPPQVPWDASSFKIQLKMARGRMDLQRGKKENEIDSTRRSIAEHLNAGKEPLAKILCERVLRERSLLAAFDIMTTFVELLGSSHTVFSVQRDFDSAPTDIKESVASIVYASGRMNIPELQNVTAMFRNHFGQHVIDPLIHREGNNVCHINKLLATKLEGGTPDGYLILEELTVIAREHNLSWIPPPEPEVLPHGGSGFGGSSGGGGGYYVPSQIPHNVAGMRPTAPPVDFAPPPMNIPGHSYGSDVPYGGMPSIPPTAPSAPFDPAGSASGTLYPSAPPSFDPFPGDGPAGGIPSAPPSAPPPPGGMHPPPPPPPPASFLSDDALEEKFRNFRDNHNK